MTEGSFWTKRGQAVLWSPRPLHTAQKNPKHPLTFAVVTRFSRMWWKCYIWVDTQFFAPFPARFHTQVEIKHVGEWILVDWMQRLDAVSWSMSSAAFCCSLCSGVFVTLTVTHHEQRCRLVYWQREGSQSPIFFRGLTHLKKNLHIQNHFSVKMGLERFLVSSFVVNFIAILYKHTRYNDYYSFSHIFRSTA